MSVFVALGMEARASCVLDQSFNLPQELYPSLFFFKLSCEAYYLSLGERGCGWLTSWPNLCPNRT